MSCWFPDPDPPPLVVTAAGMAAIEARLFAAGLPVAALMEKAGQALVQRFLQIYPEPSDRPIGILVGPGHNGGDALVMARELAQLGQSVILYVPRPPSKPLTADLYRYAQHLGLPVAAPTADLAACRVWIDGLFGIGLERPLTGAIATLIDQVNAHPAPVFSIDVPSGLHTDTGAILGTAIQATQTMSLGLWKRVHFQEASQDYCGQMERLDLGLPTADIVAVQAAAPTTQVITPAIAQMGLPLPRPRTVHKYQMGHLLLIAGSQAYRGAAVLAGLGARSSGVGLVTLAVPASLSQAVAQHLPEALIQPCPETATGAIAHLPPDLDLNCYTAIAIGPGLTTQSPELVHTLLTAAIPIVIDADALNCLAQSDALSRGLNHPAPRILTPHWGEFKRLWPLPSPNVDRLVLATQLATSTHSFVVLKGAKTAIATPTGDLWLNPESTPALARGGSGDVLTGLIGGLCAQAQARSQAILPAVRTAVWWHSQAGLYAVQTQTELGVDAWTLAHMLNPALAHQLQAACPEVGGRLAHDGC